jgi:hypothetical protein
MDSKHFDSLAKSFGTTASRRGVLKGLAVGTAGALAAANVSGVLAQNPHCVGTAVCRDVGTTLVCSGKFAGLANAETTITVDAEGTATKQCRNRGGNVPPGQTEEIDASGEIIVTPGNTGQLTFRNLRTEEPDVTDTCPGPQTPEVTDVTFTSATITASQGGVVVAECDVSLQ